MSKYYNTKISPCPELDNNEMNRLFHNYDSTGTGIFRKDDIQLIFFDIKNLLLKQGVKINDNKMINFMLDFYSKCDEFTTKDEIKKCYGRILHEYKANMLKDKVLISDLDYVKNLAMGEKVAQKLEEENRKKAEAEMVKRRDIFVVNKTAENKPRELVLNENKLEKLYK